MSTAFPHRPAATGGRPIRAVAVSVAVIALCAALAGCRPESTPTASPTPSASPSASVATPTPTPTATATAGEDITLPTSCEQIYSPEMLATLNAQNPPLNDPGVTMTSTQNVEALEALASGIPTIRCSWGMPSEYGLATNVSIVDAALSAQLASAFASAGFACEPLGAGTVCRYEQAVVDLDDNLVEIGEVHVLRGNAWISTATIDFSPDGYTEDIVGVLWG